MLKIVNLLNKKTFQKLAHATNRSCLSTLALPKICIVGSGPAALYTAQYVVKSLDQKTPFKLDIYEKLPVPFGLVRYGVAPDHQDVKNCVRTFTETLRNVNVNFYGNVNIGHDVRIDELLQAYNFVVLAYGSHSENYLNIPGESRTTTNLHSAKDIVSWYNGLPPQHGTALQLDLSGNRAMIIGAGNVAIDIARLLTSPIEKLRQTDIASHALEHIKKTNRVNHVSIVARRGVLNAAFTLKELRELARLDSVECRIDLENFRQIDIERLLAKLSRPRRRLTEYMYELALASQNKTHNANRKIIEFLFLRTPTEIKVDEENCVNGVEFQLSKYDESFLFAEQTKLDSEEKLNKLKFIQLNSTEILPCDLLVRSIGYKNVNIDENSVPFDKKLGVVLNDHGRVIGKEGLYCTGWIKRGPRGVIVDTTSDAHETASKLCNDLFQNGSKLSEKRGGDQIERLLNDRHVKFVNKDGWSRIDAEEMRRGRLVGKPREKIQSVDEMLRVAFSNSF